MPRPPLSEHTRWISMILLFAALTTSLHAQGLDACPPQAQEPRFVGDGLRRGFSYASLHEIGSSDVLIGIIQHSESMSAFAWQLFQHLLPHRTVRLLLHPTVPVHVAIGSIWTDPKLWEEQRNAVRIVLSGEYTAPLALAAKDIDMLICPRAMLPPPFRHTTPHFPLPYFHNHFSERQKYTPLDLILPPNQNATALRAKKTKFCAFLYMSDVSFRNDFFDALSGYRRVDALGRARGNVDRGDRMSPAAFDNAVELFKEYKFVISFENQAQPGYLTEKLAHPLLAGSIPIYFGAPDVGAYVNPKRFINVQDFPTVAAAVDYISTVDQNDTLYEQYLAEPVFVGNALPAAFSPAFLATALRPRIAHLFDTRTALCLDAQLRGFDSALLAARAAQSSDKPAMAEPLWESAALRATSGATRAAVHMLRALALISATRASPVLHQHCHVMPTMLFPPDDVAVHAANHVSQALSADEHEPVLWVLWALLARSDSAACMQRVTQAASAVRVLRLSRSEDTPVVESSMLAWAPAWLRHAADDDSFFPRMASRCIIAAQRDFRLPALLLSPPGHTPSSAALLARHNISVTVIPAVPGSGHLLALAYASGIQEFLARSEESLAVLVPPGSPLSLATMHLASALVQDTVEITQPIVLAAEHTRASRGGVGDTETFSTPQYPAQFSSLSKGRVRSLVPLPHPHSDFLPLPLLLPRHVAVQAVAKLSHLVQSCFDCGNAVSLVATVLLSEALLYET